ncbi:MAG: c-type cytochrome, partial [Bacteroidota bacterium]
MYSFGCGSGGYENTTITFNKDIAPIIHKNCSSCHRQGEAGPFALITYEDVRSKAKTIAKVVSKGLMPPWPADTTYSRFLGEKVLPVHQKQVLLDWIAQGCQEG